MQGRGFEKKESNHNRSMKYIGLDLNTTFEFRLPETISRQPRPQPVLQALM